MKTKRGVSALIATVLLVLITIAGFFIISTGYQKLIVEKQQQISTELVKLHCSEEFAFTMDSCWTEGWNKTEGTDIIEYGEMCWVIDNTRFVAISSNTNVLLTSKGKSIIRAYSIPFKDVPPGGSIEDCFSYRKTDLGTLEIERMKLMPILEVTEEGKTRPTKVVCDNYRDFEVNYCSPEKLRSFLDSGVLPPGDYSEIAKTRGF